MIDNVAIYASCIFVVYVVWRAALLDNILPWYRPNRLPRAFRRRPGRGAENPPPGQQAPPSPRPTGAADVPAWRR